MAYEGKKTKVFHAVPFRSRLVGDPWALFPEDYQLVAEVNTDNVDEAYYRTNDLGEGWWLDERVTAHVAPCRSTSVGDVLVLPDGKALRVCRLGYRRILEG